MVRRDWLEARASWKVVCSPVVGQQLPPYRALDTGRPRHGQRSSWDTLAPLPEAAREV